MPLVVGFIFSGTIAASSGKLKNRALVSGGVPGSNDLPLSISSMRNQVVEVIDLFGKGVLLVRHPVVGNRKQ
jgi:hypothetical protein